jgi:hypothetical protein
MIETATDPIRERIRKARLAAEQARQQQTNQPKKNPLADFLGDTSFLNQQETPQEQNQGAQEGILPQSPKIPTEQVFANSGIVAPEITRPKAPNPFLSAGVQQNPVPNPTIQQQPSYSFQGQQVDRNRAMDIIAQAQSMDDLEGLSISDDEEMQQALKERVSGRQQSSTVAPDVAEETPQEKPDIDKPWWQDFLDGNYVGAKQMTGGSAMGIQQLTDMAPSVFSTAPAMGMAIPGQTGFDKFGPAYKEELRKQAAGQSKAALPGLKSFAERELAKAKARGETSDTDAVGYFVGNLLPQTAGIAVAIGVGAVNPAAGMALGIGNTGMLTTMSMGMAADEYDEYVAQKGIESNPNDKLATMLLSGAIESGTEAIPVAKFIPKSIKGKLASTIFGTPAMTVRTGRELFEQFIASKQSRAQLAKNLTREIIEGALVEGPTEALAEIGGEFATWLYKEKEDRADWEKLKNAAYLGFAGGALMGGFLGPLSYGAQQVQNNRRREQAGKVVLAQNKANGETLEIMGVTTSKKKPSEGQIEQIEPEIMYQAIRPNGKIIEISENQVGEVMELPYDTFKSLLKGIKIGQTKVETDTNNEIAQEAQSAIDEFRAQFEGAIFTDPAGNELLSVGIVDGAEHYITGQTSAGLVVQPVDGGEKKIVGRTRVSGITTVPFQEFMDTHGPVPPQTIAPFDPANPIQKGEVISIPTTPELEQLGLEAGNWVVTGVDMEQGIVNIEGEVGSPNETRFESLPLDVFQQFRTPIEENVNPQVDKVEQSGGEKLRQIFAPVEEKADETGVKPADAAGELPSAERGGQEQTPVIDGQQEPSGEGVGGEVSVKKPQSITDDTLSIEKETENLKSKLPDSQLNTRSQATKDLISWAEKVFETKFTGDVNKGGYITWFQSLGAEGYNAANLLETPKRALEELKKSPFYQNKLKPQSNEKLQQKNVKQERQEDDARQAEAKPNEEGNNNEEAGQNEVLTDAKTGSKEVAPPDGRTNKPDGGANQAPAGEGRGVGEEITNQETIQIPIGDVSTDEKRFQNRSELDETKLQNIVENFDINQFDPIVVWNDPKDGKTYLLAGHHRLEGAKRKGLKNVPSRVFQGNEKQAVEYATELSNANRTLEKPSDRSKIYKKDRESGLSKAEISRKAKSLEGANATRVIAYSYLNPAGDTFKALQSFENSGESLSGDKIKSIAQWIGESRMYLPELTDKHENEVFKYLTQGGGKGITKREDIVELLRRRVSRPSFEYSSPLNLESAVSIGPTEKALNEQINGLNEQIKTLKAEQKTAGPAQFVTIGNQIVQIEKQLADLKGQFSKAIEADRNQLDLFGGNIRQELKKEGYDDKDINNAEQGGDEPKQAIERDKNRQEQEGEEKNQTPSNEGNKPLDKEEGLRGDGGRNDPSGKQPKPDSADTSGKREPDSKRPEGPRNVVGNFDGLNPKGNFTQAYTAAKEAGLSDAQLDALNKIGEFLSRTRKAFPQLTDIHENEIFSALNEEKAKFDQAAKNITKKITDTVTRFDFDPKAKIGLVKEAAQAPTNRRSEIDAQIDRVTKRLRDLAKLPRTNKLAQNEKSELTKELGRLTQARQETLTKEQAEKPADQRDMFGRQKEEVKPSEPKQEQSPKWYNDAVSFITKKLDLAQAFPQEEGRRSFWTNHYKYLLQSLPKNKDEAIKALNAEIKSTESENFIFQDKRTLIQDYKELLKLIGDPSQQAKPEAPKPASEVASETGKYLKAKDVETGKKTTIKYNKNPEKAPNMGSRFGQDVEPAGNYVTQKESDFIPEGWQQGEVTLNNPLVIDVTDETIIEWKRDLSKANQNKKGITLTKELQKQGYDGIITKKGEYLGEIIIFPDAVKANQSPAPAPKETPVEQPSPEELGVKQSPEKTTTENESAADQSSLKGEDLSDQGEWSESQQQEQDEMIQDFGDKIGGARKDESAKGFKRGKKDNEGPAWAKKFKVFTMDNGTFDVAIVNGNFFRTLKKGFKTEEEAYAIIPIIEAASNHRVYKKADDNFAIYRVWKSGKSFDIKDGFKTKEEASAYLASNPLEFINWKAPEIERPHLDSVERKGPDYRKGKNATAEMFQETFGFRGGEFGNWVRSDERQKFLNFAYDGLMDLANILQVPPKSLSLDGNLAIAFGSRGSGLGSGAAHYERTRLVINLTKIKGAGSLAHEWFHAFDHYLGMLDGKASKEWNADGKTIKAKSRENDYLSHSHSLRSKVRPELLKKFMAFRDTMFKKEVEREMDVSKQQKTLDSSVEYLQKGLDQIRKILTDPPSPYGRKKKPTTPEQLERFDKIADKILKGEIGEKKWIQSPKSKWKGTYEYETETELKALYKEAKGRMLSDYYSIHQDIRRNDLAKQALEEAKKGTTYMVNADTEYFSEAKKIDKTKASAYWSTPHEMAARAFESYIEDEIAKRGSSTFLVFGSDNKFYRLFDVKPYPEGQERIDINNKIKEVFEEIKVDKSSPTMPLFKKSTTTTAVTPITPRQRKVQRLAADITKNWKDKPEILVFKDGDELKTHFQDPALEAQDMSKVEAMVYTDPITGSVTVAILADKANNLNPTSLQRTIIHESVGHYGIRKFILDQLDSKDKASFQSALNEILDDLMAAKWNDPLMGRLSQTYFGRPVEQLTLAEMREVAEEYLAHRSETEKGGVWDRVVSFVREFLRKVGINLKYSDAEIRNLIANGYKVVEGGLLDGQLKPGAFAFKKTGQNNQYKVYPLRNGKTYTNLDIPSKGLYALPVEIDNSTGNYREITEDLLISAENYHRNFESTWYSGQMNALEKEIDNAEKRYEKELEKDKALSNPGGGTLGRGRTTGNLQEIASKTSNPDIRFKKTDQTQTKAFKDWFGDSKVVDSDGKPLVVYHGTDSKFNEFIPGNAMGWGPGIYFTDNQENAKEFGPIVYDAYLKIEKPIDGNNPYLYEKEVVNHPLWKAEEKKQQREYNDDEFEIEYDDYLQENIELISRIWKDLGYDGIVTDNSNNIQGKEIVVFSPTQVKSATGNDGTFSPTAAEESARANESLKVNESNWDKLVTNVQDYMRPAREMVQQVLGDRKIAEEQDFVTKENLSKSRARYYTNKFLDEIYNPIIKEAEGIFKKHKIGVDGISDYLQARHHAERKAYITKQYEDQGKKIPKDDKWPTGLTDEEAQTIIENFEGTVPFEERNSFINLVQQASQFVNDRRYESGIISKEVYSQLNLMYNDYVPLRGYEELIGEDKTMYSPLMAAHGRTSKAASPIPYLFTAAQEAILRGENNLVRQSVLEFVKEFPSPGNYEIRNGWYVKTGKLDENGDAIWVEQLERPTKEQIQSGDAVKSVDPTIQKVVNLTKGEDNVVPLLVKGKRVFIEFRNKKIAMAIKNSSQYTVNNPFMKTLHKTTRFISSMHTEYSPEFGPVNLIRDVGFGTFNILIEKDPKLAWATLKKLPKSTGTLWNYFKKNKIDQSTQEGVYLQEWLESGGLIGFTSMKDASEIFADAKREIEDINTNIGRTKKFLKDNALMRALQYYNKTLENAMRFSYYKALRESGYSKQQGAIESKDLTVNFDRKGNASTFIGSVYMFFNASAQGIERMNRNFVNKKTRNRMLKGIGTIIAAGMTQSILNGLFGGDDEDEERMYAKIPDYVRRTNIILPLYGTGEYFAIPIPYGLNAFYSLGESFGAVVTGMKDPGSEAMGILSAFSDSFSPLGGMDFESDEIFTDKLIKFILPSFLKPAWEYSINRNFVGSQIRKENFTPNQYKKPPSEMYFPGVSPTYRVPTDWLNKATGGNKIDEGRISINPEAIEHGVDSYIGGPVKFGNKVFSTVEVILSGDNPMSDEYYRKVPLVRRFLVRAGTQYDAQQKFYENYRNIDILSQKESDYRKMEPDKLEDFLKENSRILDLKREAKLTKDQIDQISDDIKELKQMNTPEARERIEKLYESRAKIMKGFNRIYNSRK